ncbi:MAG TPA: hypothetical protein VGH45_06115 [Solirubrobacteraceae bacterium]|jgi:hypothetical protein
MTITAPPETTTVRNIIAAEAKGEKDGVTELGCFIAAEAELRRVLAAVA